MPLQVAICNCYLPVDSKAFWKAFRCDSRNGFFASSYSNEVRTILWRLSSDYDRRKNCCRYGHFSALLITQSSYSFVSASARHCGTQLQRFIASDCSHGSLYPSLLSQQCCARKFVTNCLWLTSHCAATVWRPRRHRLC